MGAGSIGIGGAGAGGGCFTVALEGFGEGDGGEQQRGDEDREDRERGARHGKGASDPRGARGIDAAS